MIVKCASCQTRFKIGDDKVTEKGVKVRCTKCGTVFLVRKGDDQAAAPGPSPRSLIPAPSPRSKTPAPSPRSKTPLPSMSVGSLDDLFAIPVGGTGAAPAPAASAATSNLDDPFAGFLSATPPPPKSSSPQSGLMPGEFALAAAAVPDPASPAPPGATPMADLLGLDTAWPAAAPSPAPPRSPSSRPPKRPAAADEPDPFDAALDPLGSPGSVHPPPDPFASFAAEGRGNDASSFGLSNGDARPGEASFDPLAGLALDPAAVPQTGEEPAGGESIPEPTGELFERPPRPPAPQPVIEAATSPLETTVERQRTRGPGLDPEDGDERAERPLAAKIFSALAGASVVTLMLLAFVAYRNGGRVDLHDPLAAVFTAFGFSRPIAVSQSLTTRITESGLYANLRGDPILFVRGSV